MWVQYSKKDVYLIMDIQKGNTLKIRMDTVTFNMMEKARKHLKLDKSKFIRQSIQRMAQAVIDEYENTRLSEEDWHAFFEMIDNPPKPTNRMMKDARNYREIVSE